MRRPKHLDWDESVKDVGIQSHRNHLWILMYNKTMMLLAQQAQNNGPGVYFSRHLAGWILLCWNPDHDSEIDAHFARKLEITNAD